MPRIKLSGGVDHCRSGASTQRAAIHYVAPVGEKDDYVERAMANIEPYLFAETALTA